MRRPSWTIGTTTSDADAVGLSSMAGEGVERPSTSWVSHVAASGGLRPLPSGMRIQAHACPGRSAEDELLPIEAIEARPVEIGHELPDERRDIGHGWRSHPARRPSPHGRRRAGRHGALALSAAHKRQVRSRTSPSSRKRPDAALMSLSARAPNVIHQRR